MIGYVTIEQADEYVSQYLTPTSPAAIRWNSLDITDKTVYLRVALAQIERLVYIGFKKYRDQTLQFPRHFQEEIPIEVGYAQIEQALFRSDTSVSHEADYRLQLQRQGVTSFDIGKLSETYGGPKGSSKEEAALSNQAYEWLSSWIERCFSIV